MIRYQVHLVDFHNVNKNVFCCTHTHAFEILMLYKKILRLLWFLIFETIFFSFPGKWHCGSCPTSNFWVVETCKKKVLERIIGWKIKICSPFPSVTGVGFKSHDSYGKDMINFESYYIIFLFLPDVSSSIQRGKDHRKIRMEKTWNC